MTGSFPTRPDGLVDGARIPHDALTSDTACTHEHASRVVPARAGQVDVWHCRDCDERWKVAPASPVIVTRAEYERLLAMPDEPNQALRDLAARAAREHQLRRSRFVTVPDTTTSGPSGLLARFRNHTKKDRP